MRWLYYGFLICFSLGMLAVAGAVGAVVYAFSYYGRDLPDYTTLKDYSPDVVTRLYAGDGSLLTEYAAEQRVFVPIESIPPLVKQAFISAEDQNFYSHSGLDYMAILNAVVGNIARGGRPRGASTITQQVAKNFFLTNEVSYERKIREAILAIRMEKAMSKDRLLELYLNEIYLGERSYGVAAAALNYFNKPLERLTPDEAAYLAALPKAPNNYHPIRKHAAAVARRNWVLSRMAEDGFITKAQADLSALAPLQMVQNLNRTEIHAAYFSEEVRRELAQKFGSKSLYGGGLVVRTTVDPNLQEIAAKTLRAGLMEYDKRRGFRGPVAKFENLNDWKERIKNIQIQEGMLPEWKLAVALDASGDIKVGLQDGTEGVIKADTAKWTGPNTKVKKGDVIIVEATDKDGIYLLQQVPAVNGALVAMDPHTGRVLAMQGGWKYEGSEFNRATQAQRQPGSAFKPFVYLSALEQNFTPATLIMDAPFEIDQGPGLPKWRPKNYSGEYYGPTTLRVGLEKSRNLMTVRLADFVGIENVIDVSKRFGVIDNMPPRLSYALGAGETTALKMTTAYAQFVNGGKKITPTLIDRIQDRRGKTVYKHDNRTCPGCGPLIEWQEGAAPPMIEDDRAQVADPRHAYQMVSLMEGVVQRGTAQRAKSLGFPLAGKTGTTNDSKDAWFVGFSPDLVVGIYVGFDNPRSLGKKETGGSLAAPIFVDFMRDALKDASPTPFRIPPGIKQVRLDATTGRPDISSDKVIWESFLAGTEPDGRQFILDNSGLRVWNAYGYQNHQGYDPENYYGEGAYGAGVYQDGTYGAQAYPSPANDYMPQDSQNYGDQQNYVTPAMRQQRYQQGEHAPIYDNADSYRQAPRQDNQAPAQQNWGRPTGSAPVTGTGEIY
jgi:penicillin-binding protein 1A